MILTVGDSVCWGQGLVEAHKFDRLLAATKGLDLFRAAHSGAVIGTSGDSSVQSVDGEIPVPYPSVWQQISAQLDWTEVDLVLLNGGINDVSLGRILSPWTNSEQLLLWIDQFCHQAMQSLLLAVAAKLSRLGSRIAIVGYYPILSEQSDFPSDDHFRLLLELHGVATNSVVLPGSFPIANLVPNVVSNCLTFWRTSNIMLQLAVDGANSALNNDTCAFIKLPFSEESAMWAPNSLLWELTALLTAEDEVSDPRETVCETLYGDVVDIPQWIQCVRASAGHPRVTGAAKIADAITAAL